MQINEETVRRAVDGGLSRLVMTEEKKRAILAQCRPNIAVVSSRRRVLRRVVTVAAAFVLTVTAAAGVLAGGPALGERLDMLSSQVLSFMYPVEEVAEADGIRMEVLAAMNDEDVAVVYMSLQDTAGSGQVSDSVTLFDYQISGAVFTDSEVVQYDPTADTALLRLTGSCGQLAGQKVSVTLRSFLTGERHTPLAGPGWTLDETIRLVPEASLEYPGEYQSWMVAGSDQSPLYTQLETGRMPVLRTQGEPLALTGWCGLLAAEELDGMLHLQTRPDEAMGRFNRLQFVLTDETGARLQRPHAQVDLGELTTVGPITCSERVETILELPEDPAVRESLRVNYDLLTYDQYVEGCWSVTFRMDDAPAQRRAACAIPMGGWTLEEVVVTPLGVTVRGRGEMFPGSADASPVVVLRDGRTAAFNAASTSTDAEGSIEMKSLFCVPVPPQDVAYVEIAGQQLELTD